jgi:hypothetical protein
MTPRAWATVGVIAAGVAVGAFFLLRGDGQGDGPAEPTSSLDFELLSWRCAHQNVISTQETIEAEGEFCFAALNVSNPGETAVTLEPSCQFLLDGDSNRYQVHSEVMALDRDSKAAFGKPIRPGALIEDSALYYDVPEGTTPLSLELHEACEEPGVRVLLDPALEGAET